MARPTEYKQEYCEAVIEAGKQGKSVAWMASEFDVNKDTIYEWAKVHPEFSDALTRARAHSQRWWEDAGQTGMAAPGFGASVWSRSMAARFPEDWRENKGVELSGGVKVTNAAELSDDELAAIATGRG
jgi:deferrochelatase/peroxidase EfeB